MIWIIKLPFYLLKLIFVLVIFIFDHVMGVIVGAVMGLFKGTSGLLGMGIRSFAVGLLKKT